MRTKLYDDVMNAFRNEIPEDVLPEYDEYRDVLNICEACLLAGLVPDDEMHPSEVINLLVRCKTEYGCWIDYAAEAIANADLTMLPESEECRVRLISAYHMTRAWLFHLYRLREGDALPPCS